MSDQPSREEHTITSTHLAAHTGDVLNQVYYGGKKIVVTKRGQPIVTILPCQPKMTEQAVSGDPN